MQTYDGAECPVVHADFYRLRGAEELRQIGWDEAIDGAVTLVEWARARRRGAAGRSARDRLAFDHARGADSRRARIPPRGRRDGRRAWRARARSSAAASAPAGREAGARSLHGDASTRAYRAADRRRRRERDPDDLAAARPTGRSCATASPMRRSPGSRPTSAPFSRWPRACARSAIRRRASTPTASPTGWR